jgi:CheY-like chemotaxis protein
LQADGKPLAGKFVLVVEDETLIALDTRETLLDLGAAELVRARTVQEGLEALDRKQFDLALLDLRLGLENSLPVALRLASLGVPFGLLTGFGGDAIPPELRDRPYLPKPFTPHQLTAFLLQLAAGEAEPSA